MPPADGPNGDANAPNVPPAQAPNSAAQQQAGQAQNYAPLAALPFIPLSTQPLEQLQVKKGTISNWKIWVQRWNNYEIISNIKAQTKEYQKATFLQAIGPDALEIYNTFEVPDTATVKDVKQRFEYFVVGNLNETYERYVFNKRDKLPDESCEMYLGDLRKLAKTCNFCECMGESLIRDRIVVGIDSNSLRKKLLQTSKLTLKATMDICKSNELTTQQMRSFHESEAKVHKVRPKTNSKPKSYSKHKSSGKDRPKQEFVKCKYCGKSHAKKNCPAYGATCTFCSGKNHTETVCYKKQRERNSVKAVDEAEDSDTSTEYINVVEDQSINRVDNSDIYAEMIIQPNNRQLTFQIDSGAKVNTIPERYIDNKDLIIRRPSTLQMWNKSTMQSVGKCRLKLQNPTNMKKYSVEFIVVNDDFTPLLGSKASQQMGLITINHNNFNRVDKIARVESDRPNPTSTQQEEMQNRPNTTFTQQEEMQNRPTTMNKKSEQKLNRPTMNMTKPEDKYDKVFNEELGCLPGEVHLETDKTVKPTILPPRRLPHAIKPKVKFELESLVNKGIITPVVEPTQWVSQLAVAEKRNGKLRICIDPKPLNKALKSVHYPLPVIDDILPELAQA